MRNDLFLWYVVQNDALARCECADLVWHTAVELWFFAALLFSKIQRKKVLTRGDIVIKKALPE